jgi:hypothetical protein
MSAQEWRKIPNFSSYEVSNTGSVRSVDRLVRHNSAKSGTVLKRGQILKLGVAKNNPRARVHASLIRDDGVEIKVGVGRTVLEAFVGPCPPGMECCHNNGDRFDNRLENVRWDTRSENALDQVRHGTHFSATKTHCPMGHPYNERNTRVRPCGRRICRACHRRISLESRHRAERRAANKAGAAA